ncbi:hypothetical protein QUF80_23350, partial [Desulfococcaceae bacterium HSG8]|nr:hypothetical protein [Desulfococcaceae bacterium HSG8]
TNTIIYMIKLKYKFSRSKILVSNGFRFLIFRPTELTPKPEGSYAEYHVAQASLAYAMPKFHFGTPLLESCSVGQGEARTPTGLLGYRQEEANTSFF